MERQFADYLSKIAGTPVKSALALAARSGVRSTPRRTTGRASYADYFDVIFGMIRRSQVDLDCTRGGRRTNVRYSSEIVMCQWRPIRGTTKPPSPKAR